MTRITLPSTVFFLAVVWDVAFSNPIPPPTMEWLDIQIEPSSGTLRARVDGDYRFLALQDFPTSMSFPVPLGSTIFGVWQESIPLAWKWISDRYPTILPEMPTIPMVRWLVRLPIELPPEVDQVLFEATYEHNLIRRPTEFLYFYALGSGQYMIGDPWGYSLAAWITIHLPQGTEVRGVWLNHDPQDYSLDGSTLQITVFSWTAPVTRDLIVSLVPPLLTQPAVWVLR